MSKPIQQEFDPLSEKELFDILDGHGANIEYEEVERYEFDNEDHYTIQVNFKFYRE